MIERSLLSRPTSRRITLADVAHAVGCSASLVSGVINRSSTNAAASPALAKRIRETAQRLGYRPDFASQSLARRTTRTIGVYVPPNAANSLSYPYEAAILRGIEKVCQLHGYDLLAINLSGNASPEDCFHKFAERRIDGLVLLHLHHLTPWITPLIQRFPQVVGVNFYGDVPEMRRVNFDDRAATTLAVKHLAELGHHRIGYLGPAFRDAGPGAMLRLEGFTAAMGGAGISVRPAWIWDHGNPAAAMPEQDMDMIAAGTLGVNALFAAEDRPTALVCYDDLIALHAVRRLQQIGLRVPDDVSVIGIDDMEICRHFSPALSSIHQPLEEMGQRAAEMLLEPQAYELPSSILASELMAPRLIPRESTGKAPSSLRSSFICRFS